MSIGDKDFPSLFQVADKASADSQKIYIGVVCVDLGLMLVGALCSSFSASTSSGKLTLGVIGTTLLVCAFFVSIALKKTRYEKVWYGGRAVAESVKSLSWKYMSCASPFVVSVAQNGAESMLVDRFNTILSERKHLAFDFPHNLADQVSQKMKSFRQLPLQDRKNNYLSFRLREQREWYSKKSEFNKKKEKTFYLWALGFQFFAFLWSLGIILHSNTVNLVGFFAAVTTAIFAWMQIKKYQELAQVYALTAQELSFTESKIGSVVTDDDFSTFVSDSENAISREHTMWVARRD